MRMIAVILMILPLTVAWAEDETQVEIPSSIENLFEKSDKDNRDAVSDLIEVIAERNEELKEDVNKKLRRHKGLEAYKAAAKNGASNEDIIASPLASAEVKEVAAVYARLEAEMAKSAADYIPNDESVNLIEEPEQSHPAIGRWDFTSSNGWIEFKEDGTFEDSWGASGKLTIDDNTIRWSAGRFSHEVTINGDSFMGKRSDNLELTAVRAP